MESKTLDVRFILERETKRTYVFAEVDEDGNKSMDLGNHWIGSMYLQKSFFNGSGKPSEVFVRVSTTEEGLNEPSGEEE